MEIDLEALKYRDGNEKKWKENKSKKWNEKKSKIWLIGKLYDR